MTKHGNFRPRMAASSDLPPVVFILGRKTLPKHNIVVGTDGAQTRFMAHEVQLPLMSVDKVTDEMLSAVALLVVKAVPEAGVNTAEMLCVPADRTLVA